MEEEEDTEENENTKEEENTKQNPWEVDATPDTKSHYKVQIDEIP